MKTKTLLIAAVMFLGITGAAFAQATYTVGYIAVPTLVSSGHTEMVGDLTFTTIPTSEDTITGTIVITYSSPITYSGSIVPVPPEGAVNTMPTFGIIHTAGQKVLTITVTPDPSDPERFYGFRLTGVRVDVANQPGAAPVTGTIQTTGNGIVVGQNNVTVANAVEHGIAGFTLSQTSVYNTLGTPVSGGSVNMAIGEGYLNAFGFALGDQYGLNSSQMIKIALNEAIPAGVALTFPATDSSGIWALANKSGTFGAYGTMNQANPAVYYRIQSTTNQIALETFVVNGVTIAVTTGALPLYAPGSLTAYATLALLDADFSPINTSTIPRYALDKVDANRALITFQSAYVTTTLMIPYATTEVGYDTGIAIANTTVDPAAIAPIGQAVPQDGKIAFYFYPNAGDPFSFNTTTTAIKTSLQGQNAWIPLTDGGLLERGRSYAVMLSQLLTAAGKAADYTFHGYIIIVTDFTNAHGQYFLSDWKYFTNGAQMLVLASSRIAVPEAANH